jgi:hypothetical protein
MAWTKWLFWQNIWAFAFIAPMVRGIDASQLTRSLKLWGLDIVRFGIPFCIGIHVLHYLFLTFRSTVAGATFRAHVPPVAGGLIVENDTARRCLLGDAAVCIRKDFRRNRIMMDIVGLVDRGRIAAGQASALTYG